MFGPDLPAGKDRPDLPPKFKKTKRKTKRKATSRSKGEARSKVQRAKKGEERKKKREEWLLMRAQRREEKQRKDEVDEPVVKKVKAKGLQKPPWDRASGRHHHQVIGKVPQNSQEIGSEEQG